MLEFKISGGKLTKYLGSDQEVQIPRQVKVIGTNAFKDSTVKSVMISSGVQTIGPSAFSGCKDLETVVIEEGLQKIEAYAFENCTSLKSVALPKSLVFLSPDCFYQCVHLEKISVAKGNLYYAVADGALCTNRWYNMPKAILRQGAWEEPGRIPVCDSAAAHRFDRVLFLAAQEEHLHISPKVADLWHDCTLYAPQLTDLWFDGPVDGISPKALRHCANLRTIHFEDGVSSQPGKDLPDELQLDVTEKAFMSGGKIDMGIFSRAQKPAREMLPYIILNQNSAQWKKYIQAHSEPVAEVIQSMSGAIRRNGKFTASQFKQLMGFMKAHLDVLDSALIREIADALASRKPEYSEKFLEDRDMARLNSAKTEHPIEKQAKQLLEEQHLEIPEELKKSIKQGIALADGSGFCSVDALMAPVAVYANSFSELCDELHTEYGTTKQLRRVPQFRPEADHILEQLNRRDLSSLLLRLAEGRTYRPYILSFARFGTDEDIRSFLRNIKPMSKGKAKDKYWAENAQNALYLSDSPDAAYYFDGIGKLDAYAELRGFTAAEYRDSYMLPDFGMDATGFRVIHMGELEIQVSAADDLKLQLYDKTHGKSIKTIPSRGADPEAVKAAKEELKTLKDDLNDFIQQRRAVLMRMYWDGERISRKLWEGAYLTHPILKHISQLLVWVDGSGNTFTVQDGSCVSASGDLYTPEGDIALAHVLDMEPAQVKAWQSFLVSSRKKLLFDQMWEPVCLDSAEIYAQNERYFGAEITQKERNAFKKRMKARGIEVSSDEMSKWYDPQKGAYVYSNQGTMRIGDHISLWYKVDENTKDLTLQNLRIGGNAYKELNTLIYELDFLTIRHQVAMDRADILFDERIQAFTAAQISELLQCAIAENATNCTAALLEYKDQHFGFSAAMDEFTLD